MVLRFSKIAPMRQRAEPGLLAPHPSQAHDRATFSEQRLQLGAILVGPDLGEQARVFMRRTQQTRRDVQCVSGTEPAADVPTILRANSSAHELSKPLQLGRSNVRYRPVFHP